MYYEIIVKRSVSKEDGSFKDVTERHMVNNVDLFAEAEAKAIEEYSGCIECDVTYIKRSPVREFVNQPIDEDEKIFIATVVDSYTDDNGNEKELKYYVGLFACDMRQAQAIMEDYMKQGLSEMRIQQIKETKFNQKVL